MYREKKLAEGLHDLVKKCLKRNVISVQCGKDKWKEN